MMYIIYTQCSWYVPRGVQHPTTAPSLTAAYAYYERRALPRRRMIVTNDDPHTSRPSHGDSANNNNRGCPTHMQLASHGSSTSTTALYPLWGTPAAALAQWGTGMFLYFSTLRVVGCILLVMYAVNVPFVLFFSSGALEKTKADAFALRTSAVCSTYLYACVVCVCVCVCVRWVWLDGLLDCALSPIL